MANIHTKGIFILALMVFFCLKLKQMSTFTSVESHCETGTQTTALR